MKNGCLIFIFLFLDLILSFRFVYSQSEHLSKVTLGVIPFSHAGVKEYEAVSLSNRLHSGLVQTNQFRVVETEKVTALLGEMGMQQAGTCTDDVCVAQAGHMLGAQWMVTGTVGKVGSTFSIDIRIIDVESRNTVLSVSRDFRGEIDALLSLMPNVAQELALKTADKLKTGNLVITSIPQGAAVYLDSRMKGFTPVEIKEIPVGEYGLKLSKTGCADYEVRVQIEPLRTKKVDGFLRKVWILEINSLPDEAKIILDSKFVGKTPWSGTLVEGTYRIQLQKPYYLDFKKTILLNQNERLQISLEKDQQLLKRIAEQRHKAKPVSTIQSDKNNKKWLWVFGGTALVGGGIAAWLLMENQKQEEPVEVIGLPPEPPIKP